MSSTRIPQIQALRALAAGLVLIYHAKFISGGYIGVDIFYVISGYLITGLLLRELEETHSFNFKKFYARRAKRLLPSSALVIFVTGIAGWLLFPASMRQTFGKDLIAAAAYISNFLFALWQNDYQNLNATPSPFIHYWSLAVEEQFYLFWPLLVVLLYKIGKRKAVALGISVTIVSSIALSIAFTNSHPIWAFYILPTRAWELGVGALLIFLNIKKRIKPIFILASFAILAVISLKFSEVTPFPGYLALAAVIPTALLILGHRSWPPVLNVICELKIIQWLGNISYPLYLWHWPLLVIPAITLGRSLSLFEKSISLLLTVFLAHLTHVHLEERLRHKRWGVKRTFSLASTTTAISVLVGLFIILTYSNTLHLSDGSKYSLDQIRSKPINDTDGCHIHIGQTVSPKCEYGDKSSSEVIVLYGDSHAAQWLPALDLIAKKNKVKLISLTKSACPSTEVVKELSSQYDVSDCQAFRDASIARIAKIKPRAVILSGYQPFSTPDKKSNPVTWWVNGERKALNRITPYTNYPVYITDTPRPQIDIPDCLAAGDLSKCNTSRKVSAEVAQGFIQINPTPWLCTQTCPAIVDKLIAYRDQSHLTVAMSKHLVPKLESALKAHDVI